MPQEVAELYLAVMEDIFSEKEGSRTEQIAAVQKEIDAVEERLLKLDERYFEGDFDRDSYQRLKERFTEQKEGLVKRKRDLEGMETNFDRYARYGLSLLSDLPRYYGEAPLPVKQKLLGLIFPGDLVYEEGEYRTGKMNEVLSALTFKKQEFAPKEKRTESHAFGSQSIRVGPTGFEPVTSRV